MLRESFPPDYDLAFYSWPVGGCRANPLAWVALEGKNPCEIENDAGGILCDAVAHESSECRGTLRLESKGIPGPATRWTSHYQIGSHMDVVLQVGSTQAGIDCL